MQIQRARKTWMQSILASLPKPEQVEGPTENNWHILFTQQRCVCDKEQTSHLSSASTISCGSSLLQTHPPII